MKEKTREKRRRGQETPAWAGEAGALGDDEVRNLELRLAGAVDLRRDLYQFVEFVREKGLTRTRRENRIPKAAARKLARLLSWEEEASWVEEHGEGHWSDHVAYLARHLGLVDFDIEGVYVGYTSTEPSFPDNEVTVDERAWEEFLGLTPSEKERRILDAELAMAPLEFFERATLVPGESFGRWGCATGPAKEMDHPRIRRELLDFLSELAPGIWYGHREVVERLRERAPHLVLDLATRQPTRESHFALRDWEYDGRHRGKRKPVPILGDIYENFREHPAGKPRYSGEGRQITSETPDAFHRVEGRFLEYFLREVPYLCGMVDLAYRPSEDPHGLDVSPPFERLRAFRVSPRFRQLWGGDPALDRVEVTVLPDLEVVVEAPSYPEVELAELAGFTGPVDEDAPIYRSRLERKRVVETAARSPEAPTALEVLSRLSGRPIPANVTAELEAWTGHAERFAVYAGEGIGLLELPARGADRKALRELLGERVVDDRPDGYLLVSDLQDAHSLLEEAELVPRMVHHREGSLVSCPGSRLAGGPASRPRSKKGAERAGVRRKRRVRVRSEDLVGYRCSDVGLLEALLQKLEGKAPTCVRVGEDRLVLSASALPALRRSLVQLEELYEVSLERETEAGGESP